jgi:hypothetical protein
VLHRDIKPSNILTTAYGHPVLSDFGIAATLGEAETTEAVASLHPMVGARGAPRRHLRHRRERGVVARRDRVLAARRSEPVRDPRRRQRDDRAHVAHREGEPAPTGRVDVPRSLERILARSMSKRPQDRQASALEFIRDLQSVEEELGLPQTPLEVAMDDWALATAVDLDERTRIGGQRAVADSQGGRRRTRRSGPRSSGTVLGADSRPNDGSARNRTAPPTTRRLSGASPSRPRSSSRWSVPASSPSCRAPGHPGGHRRGGRRRRNLRDVHVARPGHRERRRLHRDRRRQASPMTRDAHYDVPAQDGDRCVRHRHGHARRQIRHPERRALRRRAGGGG